MFLVVVGHFRKGTIDLQSRDLGFETRSVLTASVTPSPVDFPDAQDRAGFFRDLLDRLEEQPGISNVALTSVLPGLIAPETSVSVRGTYRSNELEYPSTRLIKVSPGFFSTFGVDVVTGREFNSDDEATTPRVAIVNRSFAERFYPGEDPIGKQIALKPAEETGLLLNVVGVVPDLYLNGALEPESGGHGLYVPIAQTTCRSVWQSKQGEGLPHSPQRCVMSCLR